jgi:hypothetical protein
MTVASTKTTAGSSHMARMALRLRGRLQELGLTQWAWDAQGRLASRGLPGNPMCEEALRVSPRCEEAAGLAACRALAQKTAGSSVCPCGGCMLTAPVLRRRRVLGAVTACYPAHESVADGTLAQAARQMGLDEEAVRSLAARGVRHARRQVGDFLRILCWLIEADQDSEATLSENETLSANLASTYEELTLLYRISGSMKVNQPPTEFFRNICQNLIEVMHVSAAAAFVRPHAASGQPELLMRAGHLPLAELEVRSLTRHCLEPRLASLAAGAGGESLQQRGIIDNAFRSDGGAWTGIQRVVVAPMMAEDALTGMLVGFNKTTGDFDSVDLKLISSIANQASVFLTNHRLYAEVQDLLMGVLHALSSSIDAKDPYTSGHSSRVAVLSRRLAERMGLAPAVVQRIYLSGLLHDIGKIGVPEHVLRKPGRLTDEEFAQMKQHPGIGARILGGIRQLEQVVVGIYTHHERLDGKGYPQGLKGDQWPIEGRIVGLADAFDAMTSQRPYRQSLALPGVLEEIKRLSGTQFAPVVVETFLAMDPQKVLEELRQRGGDVLPATCGQEASK